MRNFIFLIIVFSIANTFAQEKKIWAKSFINEKAPELIVEKWLTDSPEIQGKFVLIDFWATWCGPCKKAIPDLNEFHHQFQNDLVVIGISDEPKGKVKRMKNPKIEYYSAIDSQERLAGIFEVQAIPHCVVINPDGIVVWEGWPQQEGFELTAEIIDALIKAY